MLKEQHLSYLGSLKQHNKEANFIEVLSILVAIGGERLNYLGSMKTQNKEPKLTEVLQILVAVGASTTWEAYRQETQSSPMSCRFS